MNSHPILTKQQHSGIYRKMLLPCTAAGYCYLLIYLLTNCTADVRYIYCYCVKLFEILF